MKGSTPYENYLYQQRQMRSSQNSTPNPNLAQRVPFNVPTEFVQAPVTEGRFQDPEPPEYPGIDMDVEWPVDTTKAPEPAKKEDVVLGDDKHHPMYIGLDPNSKKLKLGKHGFLFFNSGSWAAEHVTSDLRMSFDNFWHFTKLKNYLSVDKGEGDVRYENERRFYITTSMRQIWKSNGINEQTNDCGASALKNMNDLGYFNYQHNGYAQAIIDLYFFLWCLEFLACSKSFIIFSQYDYEKCPEYNKEYRNSLGQKIPRCNELAQEAAKISGVWHPLNHPRYDMGQLLTGNKQSLRNHYLGMINYHGLQEFYKKYLFPKYKDILIDIFESPNETLNL